MECRRHLDSEIRSQDESKPRVAVHVSLWTVCNWLQDLGHSHEKGRKGFDLTTARERESSSSISRKRLRQEREESAGLALEFMEEMYLHAGRSWKTSWHASEQTKPKANGKEGASEHTVRWEFPLVAESLMDDQ